MRYNFREVTYKGKTIRFIKATNFDSDGHDTGPINELVQVQEYIEYTEPTTLVVVMTGQSNIAVSTASTILNEYFQLYPRQYDENYMWQAGEFNKH